MELHGTYLIEVPYQCSIRTTNLNVMKTAEQDRNPKFYHEKLHCKLLKELSLNVKAFSWINYMSLKIRDIALQLLQNNQFGTSPHPWVIPVYILIILALSAKYIL